MVADAAVAVDAVADVAVEAADAVVVVAAAAVLAPPARAPFRTLLERSKRSTIRIEVHHTTHKNERYTMTTKKKCSVLKALLLDQLYVIHTSTTNTHAPLGGIFE